jgi:hypothetical protein
MSEEFANKEQAIKSDFDQKIEKMKIEREIKDKEVELKLEEGGLKF